MPLSRIFLTLSRHFPLSFIASGRSSGLHPVSANSCCMYVRAGRPAFARSYVGVYRSTSLISSSLLPQQCPACLVRLTWIVFVMGGRWPYSWCLVGCCRQDLFNIALNILVYDLMRRDDERIVFFQVGWSLYHINYDLNYCLTLENTPNIKVRKKIRHQLSRKSRIEKIICVIASVTLFYANGLENDKHYTFII